MLALSKVELAVHEHSEEIIPARTTHEPSHWS
jgi:hypothetical protein